MGNPTHWLEELERKQEETHEHALAVQAHLER